ncbi:MAG: hypothetical protein FWD27_01755 [Coriobacteriia bacterium]|nr:hypothetical protein [Coriobacteriia bacterium]
MSYDLNIWSSEPVPQSSTLLADAGYKTSNGFMVREGEGWQVVISPCYRVDPEDVPFSIMQTLPDTSCLTGINVEPISAPAKVKKETLCLCKALAKEMQGAVEDSQTGILKLLTGEETITYTNPKDDRQPRVSMNWFFEDLTFYQSDKINQLLNVLENYMPDAMPRRYGLFCPPQNIYAITGKEHFIEFLKSSFSPVWRATKPFTNVYFAAPNIEKEAEEYLQNGLDKKEPNPKSFYGKAQSEYRCGHISLNMLQDEFLQPDWNVAARHLFLEVAKVLRPFYAEVIGGQQSSRTLAQIRKEEKKGLGRSWWWRGIPRNLGYAVLLDDTYVAEWKRFKAAATVVADDFYLVESFGEASFKSIKEKTGPVPRKIAAPKPPGTAKHFPFQKERKYCAT